MKTQLALLFFILCYTGIEAQSNSFPQLADSAYLIIDEDIEYDPSYFSIPYPNGDIPKGKGVCSDVVIRAYRMFNIDLQKLVHEDMQNNFNLYPQNWGLKRPDKNIDHRRVPNLMTFFTRYGTSKAITQNSKDYQPGDIVCWDLGEGTTHIGIVSNQRNYNDTRYLIIHNIGYGQDLEDCLFNYKIIGHYVYKPE